MEANQRPGGDVVVLVHGLAAPRLVMSPLAQALGRSFGRVVNWGYSSLWSPLDRHVPKLAGLLAALDQEARGGRIHLVTHSMGGIIGRLALAEFLPRSFGRLVMIAPPNHGSHVASRVAPLLGRFIPPLVQLADHEASFVCSLPPLQGAEVGIIAGRSDLLVRSASTRLGCERDHIILPGLHSSLLWRRETADQVRHFLEHGEFSRRRTGSPACPERRDDT